MNVVAISALNIKVTDTVVELSKFTAELKRTGEVNSDLAAKLAAATHDLYRVWWLTLGDAISTAIDTPEPTPQPASDAMPYYTANAMDSSDPILRRWRGIDNIFYAPAAAVEHDSIS